MRLFRFVVFSFLSLILAAEAIETDAWCGSAHAKDRSSQRRSTESKRPTSGIVEDIPADARQRYQNWKDELLSTEFGREQWNLYANRVDFLLTIQVSDHRKYGAGTDDFKWDDEGKLVAATITLGKNLDKGFPDPVYYPVMNSLATYDGLYDIDGDILASTKIIHEIGHVNLTAVTNATVFQKQNKLMASYNSIFLKNGYNTSDPKLVALADELGAKPIEIWEDREYNSEAIAMRYLIERIDGESFSCSVFGRMKRNISDYARSFHTKFDDMVGTGIPACRN
ncbi:MAG: hypothetical protein DMF63_02790 [Acidobacteria bacterium]|nr:MAG: hypothetical protein DMF63_02790 [Acidobacteriota bacterium]